MQALIETVESLGRPRLVVVGDFMLDRYLFGEVERISPEAPVPVMKVIRSEHRGGGAGNVAAAAAALGAEVACVGLIGRDAPGELLREHLQQAGVDVSGLLASDERPTAVKTRFIGLAQHRNQQQILRADEEVTGPLAGGLADEIDARLAEALRSADAVIFQDHNKGVLCESSCPRLIGRAAHAGRPVIVDPALTADYRRYAGATMLCPNKFEAARASGVHICDEESVGRAAGRIAEITGARAVVVTLDVAGAMLHEGGRNEHLGTEARAVADGTGAGDETAAALAIALAAGKPCRQAVQLANLAGGLEVERFGVVPIRREELIDELRRMIGLRGGKVMLRERLAEELRRRRARGDRVVFTNGCFDLLHMGHVRYLQQARELGSCLVVAINSDESVRRLKGPQRPVIDQKERAEMLGALECVDYVTVFEEDTPRELLNLLRPEILVKGGTTGEIVGQDLVEAYGGQVRKLPAVEGLSTTQIIERIAGTPGPR